MFIYWIYYLALILISLLYRKDKKFIIIYFIVFSVFYSFSINIGPDWLNYKIYFEHMGNAESLFHFKDYLNEKEVRFEILFHLMIFALTRITTNYHFIVFCLNSISFVVYFKACKEIDKRDALILFTFFIVFYGNRLFVSTLRQGIAIGFFYLALFRFVKNKKWFIYSLIAFCFHSSSVIIYPILFLIRFINLKRFRIVSIVIFITGLIGLQIGKIVPLAINTLFSSFIPPMINRLIIGILYNNNSNPFDALALFQFIILIPMSFFIKSNQEKYSVFQVSLVLIVCAFVVKFHFSSISILISRLKYNFGLGFIIFVYIASLYYYRYFVIHIIALFYAFALSTYSLVVIPADTWDYIPYNNVIVESIILSSEGYFDYGRAKKSCKMRTK